MFMYTKCRCLIWIKYKKYGAAVTKEVNNIINDENR